MKTTTISQALRRISMIENQIANWTKRLKNSVVWWNDEGEPSWSYQECAEALADLNIELTKFRNAVQLTSSQMMFIWNGREISLTEANILLDSLKESIRIFRSLNVEQTKEISIGDRMLYCALPEDERNEIVEGLQKSFDDLDYRVDEMNHNVNITMGL